MKIFLINGSKNYANWLQDKNTEFVNSVEEADLVIGEGGSDVNPQYYGQPNLYSMVNPQKDEYEYSMYKKAISLEKPILGICKGSQWLSVMAGGSLFQHVTGHGVNHHITVKEGHSLIVTSTHHQMADLRNLIEGEDYELIGWSENRSVCYKNGLSDTNVCEKEPEIVFYPKIKALGIQSHPEMVFGSQTEKIKEYIDYCKKIVYANLLSRNRFI